MSSTSTICGYALADIRKSLRDAIDRRDVRAANRWSAELVTTPGAVGSLWASYWLAWATAQGAGKPNPVIPILLRQTWSSISETAALYITESDVEVGWASFRNDSDVRAAVGDMTTRLLIQPRPTPVIWPSKEITLYDIDAAPPTAAADSPIVMKVWQRGADAMEMRQMAGHFLEALERGDLRLALSAVAWTQLPTVSLQVAERGPSALPQKSRTSPIWFWLDLGKAMLLDRSDSLHRGWLTMHNAISEAFSCHFKRWSAVERMRILLAWILQLRAVYIPEPEGLWVADNIQLTAEEIDLPYKEVAAELADPQAIIMPVPVPSNKKKTTKENREKSMEAKIAEADAVIMAAYGL